MGIGEQGQVVGLPLGRCPRHGTPLLSVTTGTTGPSQPLCMTCATEHANARAIHAPVCTSEDPGPSAFAEMLKHGPAQEPILPKAPAVSMARPTRSFTDVVNEAVEILKTCPMPTDLKQFKIVQKAITNLTKILTPTEGA